MIERGRLGNPGLAEGFARTTRAWLACTTATRKLFNVVGFCGRRIRAASCVGLDVREAPTRGRSTASELNVSCPMSTRRATESRDLLLREVVSRPRRDQRPCS